MHSPKSLNRCARVRYVSPPQLVTTPSEYPGRVTIGELSNEVLLNIFRYYLDASPRFWPGLVHVCRKWRQIVFASQRALHLRLFCTHGTPVLKTVDCWPALPIVVQYGGSLALDPSKDKDDIMAALKQSDHVNSISLTVTISLLEKLSAIKRPFSELEDLVLLSRDGVQLTLPGTFRWGPRLRSLHLTRITFPALPQLLYSSRKLVDLQLHEVLNPWRLPPEALTNALSGMAQLQSLSLHFLSTADYFGAAPPSGKRVVLPALTRLDFRGVTEYLDDLVARIDAPRLGDIEVTFFNKSILDLSKLSEFIDRIEMHKSDCRTHILSFERAISISLVQPGAPACPKLQLLCEPPSGQLFSIARICIHFSAFLPSTEDLRISAVRPSKRKDSFYSGRLPGSVDSSTGVEPFRVKQFRVFQNLSTNIVYALQLLDRRGETVLPMKWNMNDYATSVNHAEQGTIEMLSDDVLLNIFRYYLDASPRSWSELAHVCQGWRQIVFKSTLGLGLRLYCTYGTPVLKTLDCWLPLPLVVDYGGSPVLSPPAPEDEENIMAALKQSNHVCSISLTFTNSLLEKVSTISEPFSELEELVLFSRDNVRLTLPSTFRWGTHLRTLHSTRIVIPALPQLLSPSTDLVDLQLHEIPNVGYFSPDAFANALSSMTQLQTLSLHFLSLPPRRNYLGLPPQSGERVVLPALTCLKYRGTSKYLDSLVARIDAPRLGDIDITFFNQPTMDASQLGRFIERIEMQTPLNQADVQTSAHAISISFTNSSTSTSLQLQITCKQLDWQLSAVAQVCDQFSPFLFRIRNLGIYTTQSSSGQDDVDGEQWLELLRAFGGAKDLRVAGELSTNILCALRPVDRGNVTVLPSLRRLRVVGPMAVHGPEWDTLLSFINSRSAWVDATYYLCPICKCRFERKLRYHFEVHLISEHAYRIMCSYCDDFKSPLHDDYFLLYHLVFEHPEVTRNDAHTNPLNLHSSEREDFIRRHSYLRTPDIVAPSTTVTSPTPNS
ncbi:hypothetical protein BJY52DRAFT_1417429 [Lactarius psammicola]|nr:hypothetical protein BJY52DRAFT_1417429 [Lactarius psammicola]